MRATGKEVASLPGLAQLFHGSSNPWDSGAVQAELGNTNKYSACLLFFLLNNGIFHVQSESGADLGQRGRQRGCGIELLSLLGPGFSFVGLFFLLSQL